MLQMLTLRRHYLGDGDTKSFAAELKPNVNYVLERIKTMKGKAQGDEKPL